MSTSAELAVHIPDLRERLREKVQSALLDLLPAEALDRYVMEISEQTLKDFACCKEGHPEGKLGYEGRRRCSSGHDLVESDLRAILREAVRDVVRARVQAWVEVWKRGPDVDALAQAVLAETTKAAADGFLQSVASAIVLQAAAVVGTGTTFCSSCRRPTGRNVNCSGCGIFNA